MAEQELIVRIESEGGALTLTPRSLLEHFLPGAQALPTHPGVYEGHVPGQPDKKAYVSVAALGSMLMDVREKHVNPIAGMYLIPSPHAG